MGAVFGLGAGWPPVEAADIQASNLLQPPYSNVVVKSNQITLFHTIWLETQKRRKKILTLT